MARSKSRKKKEARERQRKYENMNIDQKISAQASYKSSQYYRLLALKTGLNASISNGKKIKEAQEEQVEKIEQALKKRGR